MEDLVREFQECVSREGQLLQDASAGDQRRGSVTKVLSALASFLVSWEGLASDRDELPSDIVRDTLSLLLSETGPDAQIRLALLKILPALKRADARELLLDVLPWTMPLAQDELDKETQKVLRVLRGMIMDDSTELLPVLGCLSVLPLSETGRNEVWNLALDSLSTASETDLPVLVQTLFQHVKTLEDARDALDAIRTEVALLEATNGHGNDDAIALVSNVLLEAIHEHTEGELVANTCLEQLRKMADDNIECRDSEVLRQSEVSRNENERGHGFLLLDVVAILALYEHSNFKVEFENVLDSLLQSNCFPFDKLKTLLKKLCYRRQPGQPASVLYDRLVASLLSLAISLLLTPVRNYGITNLTTILNESHDFIMALFRAIDQERQEELIHSLLHLSDESSIFLPEQAIKKRSVRNRARIDELEQKREGLLITSLAVHRTLQMLAVSSRSTVARFKHVLVGRLTATANADREYASIHQICRILASLVEPLQDESGSGSGIDSSELMMSLQKLLFTSPHCQREQMLEGEGVGDTGRIIRGLLLATELIHSPHCSQVDKDCINQWVLQILLPSNGRVLDPEIGPYGLRFLAAWSKWQRESCVRGGQNVSLNDNDGNDKVFQTVKMILARTGLVQMRSHYQQRRKSTQDTILGYSTIPEYYRPAGDGGNGINNVQHADSKRRKRRRTRDMVFCTTSFVRITGMPHPRRWRDYATWTYHLVDTYLALGRAASIDGASGSNGSQKSKWTPNGWLQAAIELPSFYICLDETAKGKAQHFNDYIQKELGKFEVSLEASANPTHFENDFSSSLVSGKSLAEVREQVEILFRLSLVLVLGISLCLAVVENAHKHYVGLAHSNDGIASDNGDNRQTVNDDQCRELLQLMKYHILKLFDLKNKCQLCVMLLGCYKVAVKKFCREETIHAPRHGDQTAQNGAEKATADAQVEKIVSDVEQVVQQLGSVLSSHFGTVRFFNPKVLWECLIDPKDEDAVMGIISQETRGPQSSSRYPDTNVYQCVMSFRQVIVDHLVHVFSGEGIQMKPISKPACFVRTYDISPLALSQSELPFANTLLQPENTRDELAIHKLGMGHCIKMMLLISRWLPRCRRGLHATSSETENIVPDEEYVEWADNAVGAATKIVSSYISLVHSILVYVGRNDVPSVDTMPVGLRGQEGESSFLPLKTLQLVDCLHDCANVFEADKLLGGGKIDKAGSDYIDRVVEPLSRVFGAFLSHLRTCEDAAIAAGLVDILSALAVHGNRHFLDSSLEASWRVLHTVYVSNTNTAVSNVTPYQPEDWSSRQLPYALLEALNVSLKGCKRKNGAHAKLGLVEKALRATVLKSSHSSSREYDQHSLLRKNLLGLWGLLVISCSAAQTFGYLSKLVESLDDLLADIGGKSIANIKSELCDGSGPQIDPCTSRNAIHDGRTKKRARHFVSPIPSLTCSSFAVYFELMFHMTVATFAISCPGANGNKEKRGFSVDAKEDHEESPYKQLEDMLEIFCRLLDLYTEKFKIFPRRTSAMVFEVCKHILDLSVHHVHRCVQWRNAQPLPSAQKRFARAYDCGSMKFLKQLLDTFASRGAGRVIALCEFVRSQAAQPTRGTGKGVNSENNGPSELQLDGETWVFASHHKKVKSLMLAAEQVADALREVACSHNLVVPSMEYSTSKKGETHDTGSKRKRRVQERTNGFHEIEVKSLSNPNSRQQESRGQKRRVVPVSVTSPENGSVGSSLDRCHGFLVDDPAVDNSCTSLAAKHKKNPRIEEEEYEWPGEGGGDRQLVRVFSVDDCSSDSSASFGIVGDWDDLEESSTGSLELEAQNLFERP